MTSTKTRIGRGLLVLSVCLWSMMVASAAWAVPTGSGAGGGEIGGTLAATPSGIGEEILLMVAGGAIALVVVAALRYGFGSFQRRRAVHA